MKHVYAIKKKNEPEIFGLFETRQLAEASIKLSTHKLNTNDNLIVEMMELYSSVEHV